MKIRFAQEVTHDPADWFEDAETSYVRDFPGGWELYYLPRGYFISMPSVLRYARPTDYLLKRNDHFVVMDLGQAAGVPESHFFCVVSVLTIPARPLLPPRMECYRCDFTDGDMGLRNQIKEFIIGVRHWRGMELPE